jgi:hypothetical protein
MKRLLLLAITACGPPCADGVCSNEDYSHAQPGPCASGVAQYETHDHCVYTYDTAKLTQVECTWTIDPDGPGTDLATYTYDASGNVASIHSVRTGTVPSSQLWNRDMTWTFDAMHATSTDTQFGVTTIDTFDRATFQWMPDSLGDWVWPAAELGLQIERQIGNGGDFTKHITWTTDGHTLTHDMITFEVDDQGRLVGYQTGGFGAFLPRVHTYSYRGDRLVKSTLSTDQSNGEPMPTSYHYDKGGNLASITSDDSGDSAYDYRCW